MPAAAAEWLLREGPGRLPGLALVGAAPLLALAVVVLVALVLIPPVAVGGPPSWSPLGGVPAVTASSARMASPAWSRTPMSRAGAARLNGIATKDGTTMLDLGPAAWQMAALIGSTPDAMLGAPTPCPAYTVGDLIEHVGGLSLAFTSAATKSNLDAAASAPPPGDAARLPSDWRTAIPRAVNAMADAWRDPDAWTGMTRAGGVDLPGEVGGLVALDELLLHGWDLARALGRPYNCDETSIAAIHGFVAQFSGPGSEEARGGLFGPEVHVDPGAPLLHRVVGMAGRDPAWSPADVS